MRFEAHWCILSHCARVLSENLICVCILAHCSIAKSRVFFFFKPNGWSNPLRLLHCPSIFRHFAVVRSRHLWQFSSYGCVLPRLTLLLMSLHHVLASFLFNVYPCILDLLISVSLSVCFPKLELWNIDVILY